MTSTRPRFTRSAPPKIQVVQIGYDATVFDAHAPSDTAQRQLAYGRELQARAAGSRLTLLCLTRRPDYASWEDGNVAFVPVRYRRRLTIPRAVQNALDAIHRQWPVSLVCTQTVHEDGWGALRFGRRARVPVIGQIFYNIFYPAAIRENVGGGIKGACRLTITKKLLPRFDALRVDAARTAAAIRERGWHRRVHMIPVPVTLLQQPPPTARPAPAEPVVLGVGRLVPQKRFDRWLQVANIVSDRVPAAKFVIVGDGPQREKLQARATGLGLRHRVRFTGVVPYKQLPRYYEKANVFLLTSDYEGFGRVLVEANWNRVPAVASSIAGCEDIIVNQATGFLVPPDDVGTLAGRVVELLQDERKRQTMGTAAQARVKQAFDPDRLIRQWIDVWLLHIHPR